MASEVVATAAPAVGSSQPPSRRRNPWMHGWMRGGLLALVASAALLGGLLLFAHAPVEPATFALVFAGGALLITLRAFRRMVVALATPSAQTLLWLESTLARSSRRHLQEDKRRILKAIKELDFDHSMGKISGDDHRKVRETYQLRAIEIMRALDERPELHPRLVAELRRRESSTFGGASASLRESDDLTSTSIACPECSGVNDPDANFCKHCGVKLS